MLGHDLSVPSEQCRVTQPELRSDRQFSAAETSSPASTYVSLIGIATIVVRHLRLIAFVGLISAATAVTIALLEPRTYSSTSSFFPQGRPSDAGVYSLAAQFGIPVGTSPDVQSPTFYVDLVLSRGILSSAIDSLYQRSPGDQPKRLTTILGLDDVDEPLRHQVAVDRLRDMIETSVSAKTGVISLTVRAPTPTVAKELNERLLQLLDRFNQETRQSQAGAERRFTSNRLAEVGRELRDAENALQLFRQQNRDYPSSAQLALQGQRLSRQVTLQEQVYTSLAQALEKAKIDEVRDTPVLTVIDRPEFPVRPNGRGTIRRLIMGLLAGLVIGFLLAFAREWSFNLRKSSDPEFEEFSRAWNRALRRADR